MVNGFFNDPNVNSLSKIIAQDINIDSIIDENVKMIDKYAAENKNMKVDQSDIDDYVNQDKSKRKISLGSSHLTIDFNHNKFDIKIAKLLA